VRGNRNFRLVWLAQIVSELGDWFYSVAIFSFLLELTGSAQMVAFAFMAQVLPQCFMATTLSRDRRKWSISTCHDTSLMGITTRS